jgi:outer membrane protein assembly factor BamB
MRNLKIVLPGIFLVISITTTLSMGQDWPQWRGPGRDGKLAGFAAPQTWPKELNKKWTVTVGVGDSSPVLVGNKLYAFGRQDANEVITCIDITSGKELWHESYPAQFVVTGASARHPGTRSTPVISDDKICTLGVGGILSCLDAATGKVLWRKQSDTDYMGTAYNFETSMSPIVVDGMCIVYIGGTKDNIGKGAMIGFDLATGQAKWKYEGDAPDPSSPVIMTVDGVKQLVTMNKSAVIGVSLTDKTLLWSVPFKSRPVNANTAVVDGQTVYVTGQNMGTLAIKVTQSNGKFNTETLWTNSSGQAGSSYTAPILRDGVLFGYASGKFACLSAKTGEMLWADTTAHGQTAAIVDAGSCLIALTIEGDLIVYLPSDKLYIEIASYKVGEPEIWANPIISGKNIFIRDKDSVTLWTIE